MAHSSPITGHLREGALLSLRRLCSAARCSESSRFVAELRQINRRLVEKANQVSDMDKTIRQVIRKLQARDADLGLCNAELRRVQAELKVISALSGSADPSNNIDFISL